jgi:hypothetical protein
MTHNQGKWQAYAVDHTDERFGIGRNIVENGIYRFDIHNRTYTTLKSAKTKAEIMNKELEVV